MLDQDQLQSFREDGQFVVEDLIDEETIAAIRDEYSDLPDELYEDWYQQDLAASSPAGLSSRDKLTCRNRGKVDWFQHPDISLPHNDIRETRQCISDRLSSTFATT